MKLFDDYAVCFLFFRIRADILNVIHHCDMIYPRQSVYLPHPPPKKGNYRATFKLDTSGVYYSNCSNCCPTIVANKLHNEFYDPVKTAIGNVMGVCFVQILNFTHILLTEDEDSQYNYIYDGDYHGSIPYVIGI